jgi:prepilin-type N-terminal cleavage/methylation domain-containing protein
MNSRPAGFTLIEVMMAMGLFMFGISALLGMFQFGGGLESAARAHAELAPAIQPLVQKIKAEAWLLDGSGIASDLKSYFDQPVPGAPDFLYALDVQDSSESQNLRLARLDFYRQDPERIEASVSFLLIRRVPLSRRLSATATR